MPILKRPFLLAEDKEALRRAVKDVEQQSSAEVVITLRSLSGSYLHADLIAGIVCGCFALWFQLFSPWDFGLEVILVAPVAIGAMAAWLSSRAPGLRRLLTLPSARRQRVRSAALVVFYERGVSHTRARTGLLVYVSLLERAAEVVADRGVVEHVPTSEWAAKVAAIDASVARGEPGAALAERIRDLAPILALALPYRADDVNELADEVE